MSQTAANQPPLGPGEQILDQDLLAQIQQASALSPTDLLKIASWFGANKNDLANYLFRIAVRDQTLKTPAPVPDPVPLSVAATAHVATLAVATSSSSFNEWQDQIEDFFNGKIDAEDQQEVTFPLIINSTVVDIRWLPFSALLSAFGVLVATTTATPLAGPAVYVIGFAPDVNSLT